MKQEGGNLVFGRTQVELKIQKLSQNLLICCSKIKVRNSTFFVALFSDNSIALVTELSKINCLLHFVEIIKPFPLLQMDFPSRAGHTTIG